MDNDISKTAEQLISEVEKLANAAKSNNRLGESYIIRSNAQLIISNSRNEKAIHNLIHTIREFNSKSEKQTRSMVGLTKVIAGLTLLMLIGLCIQIYLQVKAL